MTDSELKAFHPSCHNPFIWPHTKSGVNEPCQLKPVFGSIFLNDDYSLECLELSNHSFEFINGLEKCADKEWFLIHVKSERTMVLVLVRPEKISRPAIVACLERLEQEFDAGNMKHLYAIVPQKQDQSNWIKRMIFLGFQMLKQTQLPTTLHKLFNVASNTDPNAARYQFFQYESFTEEE
ncbi:hypothetical protein Ciccas_012880 [Cichlidogyrus casuarinus]|uniref:Uncharacterized protein n=1 Tax=Cichlidogyrus casuarinus TaxID=1844966 RepID=A0ABD2PM26_9PLAT